MTREEQFKKELEEKIEKSLKEEKKTKGLIIDDCTHDWGGCASHYIKRDLV